MCSEQQMRDIYNYEQYKEVKEDDCGFCPFVEGCEYANEGINTKDCSFYKQKTESKEIEEVV